VFLKGTLGLLTLPSALVILSGMLLKEVHIPNFPYGQVREKMLFPPLYTIFKYSIFTLKFPLFLFFFKKPGSQEVCRSEWKNANNLKMP
jgi:hypothetical protein